MERYSPRFVAFAGGMTGADPVTYRRGPMHAEEIAEAVGAPRRRSFPRTAPCRRCSDGPVTTAAAVRSPPTKLGRAPGARGSRAPLPTPSHGPSSSTRGAQVGTLLQVSGGRSEAGVGDVVGDGVVDDGEGAADFDGGGRLVGVEEGAEESSVDLGVEDGDPLAFGGEGVGVGVGEALDEVVEAETTQVVGHLVGGVVGAEESGDEPAK